MKTKTSDYNISIMHKIMDFRLFLGVVIIILCAQIGRLEAQPKQELIKVVVAPDHQDWTYKVGEQVRFIVSVLKYGNPLKDVEIKYELMPEKMEPVKSEILFLKRSETMIKGGTMEHPGFLRCRVSALVDGEEYVGLATAGFEPDKIKAVAQEPIDFKRFWDDAIAKNSEIPMDVRMTRLPERCTEKVDVYQVSLQNYTKGSRIYGILCKPKKNGVYPAVLEVPGAGIRPYYGRVDLAEAGVISLQIGIHGIPVTMDPSIYHDLRYGALNGYWNMNLDNRDDYYYKRVYLGCIRAVDFINSLPDYDGINLAVTGGSQGGALTLITAGLDPRVRYLAAFYPALSDLEGYMQGRAGGWPHMFQSGDSTDYSIDKLKTAMYYDVANFAKHITQQGWYSWGYNDTVCPPTSMFAAYNEISAPKELHIFQDTGHWTYQEQRELKKKWLLDHLK